MQKGDLSGPDSQSGYRHLYRKLYPEIFAKSNNRGVSEEILAIKKKSYENRRRTPARVRG
jgi:anti-sigma factor ChrR (cupin superfamily)